MLFNYVCIHVAIGYQECVSLKLCWETFELYSLCDYYEQCCKHFCSRWCACASLWGDHGQSCLELAKICLINATATGTEILKNLILPGLHMSVTY